ncbi:heparan-alpha-glucosaminide N-acetyltransferase domain-containing protein [Prosthecobacter sp.]|uniref:heparan-alpha-glucosaminide N-acetyltransferase domain-containing protein n=1 Tax=Prosthecobacter sp. TaxID=1965333 RepID=UPI002ABA68B8|nr:heparan-alpha-glucosaminide N-acetyltransferase domain-containing protein [Prosthecobacter sp.]MDZ4405877.1 heparan-alpha-glucosaminide N-acetyltransferase domain-containing protein [Prosthecobacter sp.]
MPTAPQRLAWLDLFRGLAVLGMVWTHSAHTFLDVTLQKTAWFHEMDYYHGLIAPAFFWIAGFVRAHVTIGKSKPAWPAFKRLLLVLLIGYAMHVPWHTLLMAESWRDACKVDVLHCLAISGMLMLFAERFGRWRNAVAAVLLVFFVGLQTSAESWHTGVLFIDQYFNRNQGSLFALFPWVGFGLAGFLTRSLWNGAQNRNAALTFVLGALLAFVQPYSPWPGGAPEFFLERLGWVMMAAVFVACVADRISAATGWLRLAGRESLLLYVVHLMLIHAVPLPKQALQQLIGMTQPLWVVFLIFVALFAASLALGWWNERRKARQ